MLPLQTQRRILGHILLVTLAVTQSWVPPGWAADRGRFTLLFYDRDGIQLSPEQIRHLSNNGSVDLNNDFLIDPLTLRAIAAKPLQISGSNFTFDVVRIAGSDPDP
jgi:hypothetical protein